ncbi:Acyl-CoA oxidase dehydrogenase and Acyl-CoA oxidase domain containing protein [Aphelenchoides fujianensis]|nr:Acyl-CoA oxidase dehydrogenase and Acyl-CoA oxidase domain containing protein [Aphelenchoides fujianensis]
MSKKENRYIQPGDHPDLTSERLRCRFDHDGLAAQVYGGRRTVENRKRIQQFVESKPELRATNHDFSFLTAIQTIEQSYKNAVAAEKFVDEAIDRDDFDQIGMYRILIDGDEGHPFLITHFLVLPMLETNADDEQRRLFLEPVKKHVWPTAYCQTELGHGTNVNKMETTATYDPQTEEFVLNSPTRTSLKWWPGNVAVSAQVAIVMAQLYTQGKCHGMHPFFVFIRDENTHEPLPGVIVGDCGPNFGLPGNDIGYLGFKNYRVPRKSLLMRHYKVHPDGRYEPPLHPRLAHTGMMFARSRMIHDVGVDLAAAATIAIRYSCIRRQGEVEPGQVAKEERLNEWVVCRKGEVKILDYTTQQFRVLPQLARAFNFCLVGLKVRQLYFKVMDDVKKGDPSLMEDLHAITSGLKAVVSFQGTNGAEQLRLACGGHGYSLACRIPQLYTRIVAGCTYEGDNMVMLLQLARYLMKRAKEMRSNQKPANVSEIAAYLFHRSAAHSEFTNRSGRLLQCRQLQSAFEHVARRLTLKAFDRLQAFKAAGEAHEVAWNKTGVELVKAARAHTRTFLSRTFIDATINEPKSEVEEVMGDLLHVYLHYELQDCRADVLEDGHMTAAQLRQSASELKRGLELLRKDAVNISDSFDMPDRYLCSVLGRRDGNVYENLLDWAKASELNQWEVLPHHHELMGKLMKEAAVTSKL